MAADIRTPDKLVDGHTAGAAAHSWLAPLVGDRPQAEVSSTGGAVDASASLASAAGGPRVGAAAGGNVVHIQLDAPVLLGAMRVWNYAAAPERGVQEMEVYLDEQLVWKVGWGGGRGGGGGWGWRWGGEARVDGADVQSVCGVVCFARQSRIVHCAARVSI